MYWGSRDIVVTPLRTSREATEAQVHHTHQTVMSEHAQVDALGLLHEHLHPRLAAPLVLLWKASRCTYLKSWTLKRCHHGYQLQFGNVGARHGVLSLTCQKGCQTACVAEDISEGHIPKSGISCSPQKCCDGVCSSVQPHAASMVAPCEFSERGRRVSSRLA